MEKMPDADASTPLHVAYDRGNDRRTLAALDCIMTHRQGPTKKLIPAIGPENRCAHTYSEDDGLQLEIECGPCQGAQDLDNRKCVSGILNVLVAGAVPETIILKRFVHKRYRGAPVARVSELARSLASINRAIASSEVPSDRKCRTCPASSPRILESVRRRLLEDPTAYFVGKARFGSHIRSEAPNAGCPRAERCAGEALAACAGQSGGA